MAGAVFQVLLEMLGEVQGFEGRVELDSPGRKFGCVEAFAGIVFGQPVLQISRVATMKLLEGLPSVARNRGILRPSFAKATEDTILRSAPHR